MTATPESVMRTWFEHLWNQGDETTIDTLLNTNGVIHGLSTAPGGIIRGPAEFKTFYRGFREAFPDVSIDLERVVTEGDTCVAYCRVVGTHRGDGLGFGATNRPIDVHGFAMGRIVDGQLIEGWNCFDFLSLYQQVGVPLALPTGEQPVGS